MKYKNTTSTCVTFTIEDISKVDEIEPKASRAKKIRYFTMLGLKRYKELVEKRMNRKIECES